MDVGGSLIFAWATVAIVCALLSICAVLKLHEAGIYLLREVSKIIRRPWFETALLLFFACGPVVGADLVFLFAKHLGSSTEQTWCPFYGPTIVPREELIQNVINQWEGDDADLYQVDIMDLSGFEKLKRGQSE